MIKNPELIVNQIMQILLKNLFNILNSINYGN
jgi:hypothetical protein